MVELFQACLSVHLYADFSLACYLINTKCSRHIRPSLHIPWLKYFQMTSVLSTLGPLPATEITLDILFCLVSGQ